MIKGLDSLSGSPLSRLLPQLPCFPTCASFVLFHVDSRLIFCSLRSPHSLRFNLFVPYCSVVSTVTAVAEDGT